jgi:hypothetical protein
VTWLPSHPLPGCAGGELGVLHTLPKPTGGGLEARPPQAEAGGAAKAVTALSPWGAWVASQRAAFAGVGARAVEGAGAGAWGAKGAQVGSLQQAEPACCAALMELLAACPPLLAALRPWRPSAALPSRGPLLLVLARALSCAGVQPEGGIFEPLNMEMLLDRHAGPLRLHEQRTVIIQVLTARVAAHLLLALLPAVPPGTAAAAATGLPGAHSRGPGALPPGLLSVLVELPAPLKSQVQQWVSLRCPAHSLCLFAARQS